MPPPGLCPPPLVGDPVVGDPGLCPPPVVGDPVVGDPVVGDPVGDPVPLGDPDPPGVAELDGGGVPGPCPPAATGMSTLARLLARLLSCPAPLTTAMLVKTAPAGG